MSQFQICEKEDLHRVYFTIEAHDFSAAVNGLEAFLAKNNSGYAVFTVGNKTEEQITKSKTVEMNNRRAEKKE